VERVKSIRSWIAYWLQSNLLQEPAVLTRRRGLRLA